jgi:hypothetical protein
MKWFDGSCRSLIGAATSEVGGAGNAGLIWGIEKSKGVGSEDCGNCGKCDWAYYDIEI